MRYLLLILLLLLSLPSFAHAQKTVLATVEKDGKYGCINAEGEEVVPVIYDGITDWSEGMIAVNKGGHGNIHMTDGGKWGFCTATGKLEIAIKYDDARQFNEGLAAVKVDSLWGFIDIKGNVVIKPQFMDAADFSEGLCGVEQFPGKKWGFIDKKGNWVILPKFKWVKDFSKGYCRVLAFDKARGNRERIPGIHYPRTTWGMINKTGKYIIKPRYAFIEDFQDGLALVDYNIRPRDTHSYLYYQFGYVDTLGRQLTKKEI